MKKLSKHFTLLMTIMGMIIFLSSCSSHDDEPTQPSKVVKCKVTCEVEYPETCYEGETIEIKLLSIKVVPESTPAPYVRDVVLSLEDDFREKKRWEDKPLTFEVKITDTGDMFREFVFTCQMSDNLQTYTSNIYKIKVLRQK